MDDPLPPPAGPGRYDRGPQLPDTIGSHRDSVLGGLDLGGHPDDRRFERSGEPAPRPDQLSLRVSPPATIPRAGLPGQGQADDGLGVDDLAGGDQARHVGEGDPLDRHVLLLDSLERRHRFLQVGARKTKECSSQKPGELKNVPAVEAAGHACRPPRPAPAAPSPRAARRPRRACRPGFQQLTVDRGPVLPHQDHLVGRLGRR